MYKSGALANLTPRNGIHGPTLQTDIGGTQTVTQLNGG